MAPILRSPLMAYKDNLSLPAAEHVPPYFNTVGTPMFLFLQMSCLSFCPPNMRECFCFFYLRACMTYLQYVGETSRCAVSLFALDEKRILPTYTS